MVDDVFDVTQPNEHMVNAIIETSTTKEIVASEDIFDENGVKLLAKGKTISPELRSRLLERKLKQPLETVLTIENGVSAKEMVALTEELLNNGDLRLKPFEEVVVTLLPEIEHINIHPSAQLLLTSSKTNNPNGVNHAVVAMLLAGSFAMRLFQDRQRVHLAMISGLLHDIGETYVNPEYLRMQSQLTVEQYRSLLIHPQIGSILASTVMNYPQPIAKAIAEHHERSDGLGYPNRVQGENISEIGRILMSVEALLGICNNAKENPWIQASFAFRAIPREFDQLSLKLVEMGRQYEEVVLEEMHLSNPNEPRYDGIEWIQKLKERALHAAEVAFLIQARTRNVNTKRIVDRAISMLERIQKGARSTGLWSVTSQQDVDWYESVSLAKELSYRLNAIRRESLWPEQAVVQEVHSELEPLWVSLSGTSCL